MADEEGKKIKKKFDTLGTLASMSDAEFERLKQRLRGKRQQENKLLRVETEVRLAMAFAGIKDEDIIDGLRSFIAGESYHKDEFYDNAKAYGLSFDFPTSLGMVDGRFSNLDPEGQLRRAIEELDRAREKFVNSPKEFHIELRILLNALPYLKGLGVFKKYDIKSPNELAKGLYNALEAVKEMKAKMQKLQADDAIFEQAVENMGKEVPEVKENLENIKKALKIIETERGRDNN